MPVCASVLSPERTFDLSGASNFDPLYATARWSARTSGNRSQMGRPRKRLEQAKTVATGCDQLPIGAHGKEGVSGSSPEEGSAKSCTAVISVQPALQMLQCAVGMEPFLEL